MAPTAAILEYRSSAKSEFTWEDRVWIWWVLRVLFEVMIVVIAVAIVNGAVRDDDWAPAAVRGLVIGASVPAITRSYFFSIETNSGTQKIGIAHIYDLVVDFIHTQITDIETEAESSWAHSKAYPKLVHLGWSANTLAFRLADVAERRLSPEEFEVFHERLRTTLAEPASKEDKLRATIAHARTAKATRTLRSIVEKEEDPPQTGLV